jgi:hypothetical protein
VSDKIIVTVTVSTNRVGSQCKEIVQVDREDWEGMSNRDRDEFTREIMFGMIDWGWTTNE